MNALPATKEQLLTRRDLAARWQCSVETCKRRERERTLRGMKLGRTVRYRLADVLEVEAKAAVI